jgi:predicted phage terminase large subunit-like protein
MDLGVLMADIEITQDGLAKLLLQRRKARTDLIEWAKLVQPDEEQPARHHILLMDELTRVNAGLCTRLMICAPPGSAKSHYGTVLFVPWWIANNPRGCILSCSNTDSLVKSFSKKIKRIIDEHSKTLGYSFVKGSDSNDEWETTNGVSYKVLGVGSSSQGRRADLVIVDDPFPSRELANSPTYRDKVYQWFRDDIIPRIKPGGKIVVINTRFHQDDLSGRLLADNPDRWNVVSLPAIAESDSDPLGRQPGELLWPEYHNAEYLDNMRDEVGAMAWASLYQQRPAPQSGTLFDIARIGKLPAPPAGGQIVRAWDLAWSAKMAGRDPDWTVGLKLTKYPDGRLVVLDVVRLRGEPQDVYSAIQNTASHDGTGVRIIIPQDPSSGKAVVSTITTRLNGYRFDVVPVRANKTELAYPVASQVNVGNLSIVDAQWNRAFLDELAAFGSTAHDDQVDALSLAASALVKPPGQLRNLYIPHMAR